MQAGAGRARTQTTKRYDATDAWKGTQRAILLTVALAQP